ncbi:MAG: JAB domain-containing protein [Gammaproteobacteria bacterium]|nr:MAG: JAB domain-containing protein [Gammaproteobacteria bacterium]TDJ40327.1 MAG: JAB domain-containing protein [Gammaproteobacteria bacterium]
MTITDWPLAERPRERLLAQGGDALSDAELLAVVLRSGDGRRDAVQLGRTLLAQHGSLRELIAAPVSALLALPGLGPAKVAALKAVPVLAQRCFASTLGRASVFAQSADVRGFLSQRLGAQVREVFAVLLLDSQHRLIRYSELFFGTIDSASVHPRELLREAIRVNAAAVILVHNHPSGVAEPSAPDIRLTERLKDLLAEIDVRVLDHMIVAGGEITSLAERGLL